MCFRTFVAIKVPWMFNFWSNKNTLNYQCHRSDVWHQYKKPDSVNQRPWLIKKQSHSLNDICVKFCYNQSISKNNILQPPTHIILFKLSYKLSVNIGLFCLRMPPTAFDYHRGPNSRNSLTINQFMLIEWVNV